jgi:LDH2 family malate/lactate/ureidoglycolate dehydrogenase
MAETETVRRIVAPDRLRAFYWAMLDAVGLPRSDAEIVADCLLTADLRGVDSHGILHLGGYMQAIRDGWINALPDTRLIHETPTTAVMEADGGLGQIACVKAMEVAIGGGGGDP